MNLKQSTTIFIKPYRGVCLLAGFLFSLSACSGIPAGEPQPVPSASDLFQDQLLNSSNSAVLSARNALNQARFAFLQISGRLQFVSPDLDAYKTAVDKVLPAMILAANALSASSTPDVPDSDQAVLKQEFQQLYSDTLNQMLTGINLNMQIYQNQFETPQSLGAGTSGVSSDAALKDLGDLFQVTEYAERYVTELAAFEALFTQDQPKQALLGLRNQQTVVINGLLNFTGQTQNTALIQSTYSMVAQSLTNPSMLTQLSQLAVRAFGEDQVAYRKDEVTTTQPNPNKVILVVKESNDRYRLVQIENGVLKNQTVQDNRGLRASDFLNQTNVVLVNPSAPPS
jgi:hypothetical protein